ncbi:DNA mismatch repair protein MutS [Anaerolentibacter hominis]|uniref:DNA mismatch repair protein MutS n=1 Tax=Anaerolentibacter hominis TaxID=3079009 RepID=UPI0031B881A5
MNEPTPMMKQYLEIKKQYEDCILFYRLGDFYEMFYEDALTASRELEITLTGKNCGQEERAPMCGIPYHAVEGYLNKLVQKGYKVAICEQTEDPKTVKGIVKREVIRIVTPGTNLNTQALDEGRNNYLMGIILEDGRFGISTADVTTGDYVVTEVEEEKKVLDEINKFTPSEIICNEEFLNCSLDFEDLKYRLNISFTKLEPWYYDRDLCRKALKDHFRVAALQGLGLTDYTAGILSSGAVLQYLLETQKNSLEHLIRLVPYETNDYMILDSSTRRNLELTETLREKTKRGSLLWVLDKTKTAMGARLLRNYIEQPLINRERMEERLDAIEDLNNNMMLREELREYLNPIYDLERLIGKVSLRTVNPRDFIALKSSLSMLPYIQDILGNFKCSLLTDLFRQMDTLEDVYRKIDSAIEEEPPITIREGGFIKEGYDENVDKFRKAKTDGKTWLSELEAKERENTGIKNLRIRYNKVFGYYLEVTNSYQDLVPETWMRKQTLANAERYITPELKELEDMILGAEDKLYALEYDLFQKLRDSVASHMKRIQDTARALANLDVLVSLAYVAEHNQFVRPQINEEGIIDIKDGRHPVVELMIPNDMFVANDTYLDGEANRVSIITGPNMAGKSTYMRQTALIVLMAQIGSFVPASSACVGIVDRIFTRVGASDDLASGQSTFMVEMTEVANILRNATRNSLLILDEIGRGTSTFDGLSIAWAVVEHIANPRLLGAKALFATHYHELTELEGKLDSVNNYCIAVKEQGDDIVFLRKIMKGGADKSYGIQVARLAGVPENVLIRAGEIAKKLSENDVMEKARKIQLQEEQQLSLFDPDYAPDVSYLHQIDWKGEIIDELLEIDLNNTTPMQALNLLSGTLHKIREKSNS